jgi:hypothetical protein
MSVGLKDPEGAIMALQYSESIDSNHSALTFLRDALSILGENKKMNINNQKRIFDVWF